MPAKCASDFHRSLVCWKEGNHSPVLCFAIMKTLSKWLLNAAALLAVAHFYSGVEVTHYLAALIAALVIGLFNAILRPILVILTLPVTIITMGLFLFVINALLFWAAASVLDGFYVQGFTAALIGSVMYTAAGLVINLALESLFAHK
jgi:putative membrane protein